MPPGWVPRAPGRGDATPVLDHLVTRLRDLQASDDEIAQVVENWDRPDVGEDGEVVDGWETARDRWALESADEDLVAELAAVREEARTVAEGAASTEGDNPAPEAGSGEDGAQDGETAPPEPDGPAEPVQVEVTTEQVARLAAGDEYDQVVAEARTHSDDTVAAGLEWVGDNLARAAALLHLEVGKPESDQRATLVRALERQVHAAVTGTPDGG